MGADSMACKIILRNSPRNESTSHVETVSLKTITLFLLGIVCVSAIVSCAEGDQIEGLLAQVETPLVNSITPNHLSVGETMIIRGNNFIAENGYVELKFVGTYDGEPVELIERADYVSPDGTEIKWTFGPNIPFARGSNKMGEFITNEAGQGITVVNVNTTFGKEAAAEAVKHNILTDDSILINNFIPLDDGGCSLTKAGKLSETVEDAAFVLEVEATGLNTATPENPITFYYALQKNSFDFADPVSGLANPEKIDPTNGGFITVINTITEGTTSVIGRSSLEKGTYTVDFDNVSATGDMWKLLTRSLPRVPFVNRNFKTQSVKNETQSFYDTSINILARDSAGNIRVWKNFSLGVEHAGSERITQIEPIILATDCLITQLNEQDSFSQTVDISRERDIKFRNQSGLDITASLPLTLEAKASTAFAVEVEDAVRFTISKTQTRSFFIEPNFSAVLYAQPVQVQRFLPLIHHSVCGDGAEVGKSVLTDYRISSIPAKRPVSEGNCTNPPRPDPSHYSAPMTASAL